jgi:hypothetical protein
VGGTLAPLAQAIAARYLDYLPRQRYALRHGLHANSAFGVAFALDYARDGAARRPRIGVRARGVALVRRRPGRPRHGSLRARFPVAHAHGGRLHAARAARGNYPRGSTACSPGSRRASRLRFSCPRSWTIAATASSCIWTVSTCRAHGACAVIASALPADDRGPWRCAAPRSASGSGTGRSVEWRLRGRALARHLRSLALTP